MVNVYVFRMDGTTPSGWYEVVAGYQNRLILLGGTILETGGNDWHNYHGTSGVSIVSGGSSSVSIQNSSPGTSFSAWSAHSHGIASCSVSNETHLPPYKNYRLVYRDITGWNGKVPSGTILLAVSGFTGWTELGNDESHFVRIASSAGGMGGQASHGHSGSGQTAAYSATNHTQGYAQASPNVQGARPDHYHTFSYSAGAVNHDYNYFSTGLISANGDNTAIRAGMYAFFDGDPGARWSRTGFDHRFFKKASSLTGSVAWGGSFTVMGHTHGINTSTDGTTICWTWRPYNYWGCMACHTHTLNGSLDYLEVVPSYIRLDIYQCVSDFVDTLTVTYSFDALVKKLNIDVSATSDLVIKKLNIPASTDTDLLLKRISNVPWSMSTSLRPGGYDLECDVDVLLKRLGIEISAAFDLLQQKRSIPSLFSEDMILKKVGLSVLLDQDLLLRGSLDITYLIDHILKKILDATADFDVLFREDVVATYLMDLVEKKAITIGYAADLLQKKFDIGISAAFDLLVQKRSLIHSFDVDMLLKKLGLSVSSAQDLLIRDTFDKEYSIDHHLKNSPELTYVMDLNALGDVVALYQMDFKAGKSIKLAYLVEAIFFGPADVVLRADVILSNRPTHHRCLRHYPTPIEVPVGTEEVHGESSNPDYGSRQTRTYPEVEPEPPEPIVHPEHFDPPPLERRNRQVRSTYR